MNETLIAPDEAARRLGLDSTETLRRLRRLRRIGFVKVGRQVRFREADIAQFIESNYVAAR